MKLLYATSAILTLVLVSCSESGPQPPAKGSPAFYWTAATDTFKTGDYMKTNDHLEKLASGEYAAKAAPWRLILVDGLARGYAEMADRFETGARSNKTNQAPFRRQTSDFRSNASRLALSFAETLQKFEKSNPTEVALDFPFPSGSATPVTAINKAAEGILVSGPELETASKAALDRSVLLAVTRAVGADEDAAKAREAFKSGAAKVSADVFWRGMAESALDQADMFGSLKLDQPDRYKYFCEYAMTLAKKLPAGKETKDLVAKIEAAMKKMKKT